MGIRMFNYLVYNLCYLFSLRVLLYKTFNSYPATITAKFPLVLLK